MSSDRPSDDPSSPAEPTDADLELAKLVRSRGEPLLEALEEHLPGARDHGEACGSYAFAAAVVGLGMSRGQAELCRETARLHDIGMVYVPIEIAATSYADLTPEQRRVFDDHYEAGARLALGAGIPDDVCGWLLQIRERFDGRGPDGLANGAIPIAARIARAACACDLSLAAPQAGESLEERRRWATEALRGASGLELDPEVAGALSAVLERGAGDIG